MDEGAPAREDLRVAPSGRDDEDVDHSREGRGVAAEGRPAEPVVHQPTGGEARHRDGDRLPRLERHYPRIDEPCAGVEVELHHEQSEAGHPGEVRLPLEPGEVLGQGRGRDRVLLHAVEAAAVHLPRLAGDPGGSAFAAAEREVEGDEVERGPDPGDPGDEVGPADEQVEPVEGECGHGRGARRREGEGGSGSRTRPLAGTFHRVSSRADWRPEPDIGEEFRPTLSPAGRGGERSAEAGAGALTGEARRRRPSHTSSCREGCRRRGPPPRRSPSCRPACRWGR